MQKIKYFFFIIFCFSIVEECYCQKQIDSLNRLLKVASSDSIRIDLLNELSLGLQKYSYHKSINRATEALNLSVETADLRGKARALQMLGTSNWLHTRYNIAEDQLKKAIILYDSLKDDRRKAESMNTIGLLYYYQGYYHEAIHQLKPPLEFFISEGDTSYISRLYNNLGLIHQTKGEFAQANTYLIEGLKLKLKYASIRDQYYSTPTNKKIYNNKLVFKSLFQQKKKNLVSTDVYERAQGFSEMGTLYSVNDNLDSAMFFFKISESIYDSLEENKRQLFEIIDIAYCYAELKQLTMAEHFYKRALTIALSEHAYATYGKALVALGDVAIANLDNEKAIFYYKRGLDFVDSVNHRGSKPMLLLKLSKIYLSYGQYELSIDYAKQSYQLAEKLQAFARLKDAALGLYNSYKASDDAKNALKYQEIAYRLERKQENAQIESTKLEYQAIFELQEKSQEITLLSNRNKQNKEKFEIQRLLFASSIIGLIIILGFTIALRKGIKKEKRLNKQVLNKNEENELLLGEIHHRVKNNLQVISSLLSMQERSTDDTEIKSAILSGKQRINSMELVHKMLYVSGVFSGIEMNSYVKNLFHALVDSFVLKEVKVKLLIDFPPIMLDTDTAIPLGLILNELITNSIKHCDVTDSKELKLTIAIEEKDNTLFVHYLDNGNGKIEAMKESESFGLRIIKSFVKQLQGEMEVTEKDGLVYTFCIKNYNILKQDEN